MIYCTMNESPKGKSLEGTVGSKEKEFEIEGKLIAIDRPTVGRYVLVTVERDDSTFCVGKYDYGDADVSARMESSFRYYSGKRVKLKLGQSLNKSQDFYEGLGPVQLVKSKNEENGSKAKPGTALNPDKRYVIGSLNAVKTLNGLLEVYLFPHGITCTPKWNNIPKGSYEYVDSPKSQADTQKIPLAIVRKSVFFRNVTNWLNVGYIVGLDDNLRTDVYVPIFDENGLHNINIVPVGMKDIHFDTPEYESGIVVPLRNFAVAYEKTSGKKVFMRINL